MQILRGKFDSSAIAHGSSILAAVSGGSDSVAMLLLLLQKAGPAAWRLTVGHINHGLREEAGEDAAFVRELCGRLNLPYYGKEVEVTARPAISPELAARQARRQGLLSLAGEAGADWIALAHHGDDQAETLLMRVLQGSGPGGLAAMRPFSPPWWRPMLNLRGRELRAFLCRQGQEWREDQSNSCSRFTRNRVRHNLMPLIEDLINPRAVEAMSRLASLCALENDFWRQWCQEAAALRLSREGVHWLLRPDPAWHEAQTRRFIRHCLALIYQCGQHVLAVHVEQMLKLLGAGRGKRLPLPGPWQAWRVQEGLRLTPKYGR
ncbi:MAG: tRNA lysidine(34) synthetase TilS [Desulfarculales bacterium]|jgi:tRNA(Ile)-lysidine synthase|nr:tRNA lysidine(34) synthetase TilS [Desulfarculales bacterium]